MLFVVSVFFVFQKRRRRADTTFHEAEAHTSVSPGRSLGCSAVAREPASQRSIVCRRPRSLSSNGPKRRFPVSCGGGDLMSLQDWRPPADWVRIRTIDAHTGGRTVPGLCRWLSGAARRDHPRTPPLRPRAPRPPADGAHVGAARPRRHVRLPRHRRRSATDADFGVLFLHNEGYQHHVRPRHHRPGDGGGGDRDGGGRRDPRPRSRIDTPAGRVRACARVDGDRVDGVRFRNVPSFVLALR